MNLGRSRKRAKHIVAAQGMPAGPGRRRRAARGVKLRGKNNAPASATTGRVAARRRGAAKSAKSEAKRRPSSHHGARAASAGGTPASALKTRPTATLHRIAAPPQALAECWPAQIRSFGAFLDYQQTEARESLLHRTTRRRPRSGDDTIPELIHPRVRHRRDAPDSPDAGLEECHDHSKQRDAPLPWASRPVVQPAASHAADIGASFGAPSVEFVTEPREWAVQALRDAELARTAADAAGSAALRPLRKFSSSAPPLPGAPGWDPPASTVSSKAREIVAPPLSMTVPPVAGARGIDSVHVASSAEEGKTEGGKGSPARAPPHPDPDSSWLVSSNSSQSLELSRSTSASGDGAQVTSSSGSSGSSRRAGDAGTRTRRKQAPSLVWGGSRPSISPRSPPSEPLQGIGEKLPLQDSWELERSADGDDPPETGGGALPAEESWVGRDSSSASVSALSDEFFSEATSAGSEQSSSELSTFVSSPERDNEASERVGSDVESAGSSFSISTTETSNAEQPELNVQDRKEEDQAHPTGGPGATATLVVSESRAHIDSLAGGEDHGDAPSLAPNHLSVESTDSSDYSSDAFEIESVSEGAEPAAALQDVSAAAPVVSRCTAPGSDVSPAGAGPETEPSEPLSPVKDPDPQPSVDVSEETTVAAAVGDEAMHGWESSPTVAARTATTDAALSLGSCVELLRAIDDEREKRVEAEQAVVDSELEKRQTVAQVERDARRLQREAEAEHARQLEVARREEALAAAHELATARRQFVDDTARTIELERTRSEKAIKEAMEAAASAERERRRVLDDMATAKDTELAHRKAIEDTRREVEGIRRQLEAHAAEQVAAARQAAAAQAAAAAAVARQDATEAAQKRIAEVQRTAEAAVSEANERATAIEREGLAALHRLQEVGEFDGDSINTAVEELAGKLEKVMRERDMAIKTARELEGARLEANRVVAETRAATEGAISEAMKRAAEAEAAATAAVSEHQRQMLAAEQQIKSAESRAAAAEAQHSRDTAALREARSAAEEAAAQAAAARASADDMVEDANAAARGAAEREAEATARWKLAVQRAVVAEEKLAEAAEKLHQAEERRAEADAAHAAAKSSEAAALSDATAAALAKLEAESRCTALEHELQRTVEAADAAAANDAARKQTTEEQWRQRVAIALAATQEAEARRAAAEAAHRAAIDDVAEQAKRAERERADAQAAVRDALRRAAAADAARLEAEAAANLARGDARAAAAQASQAIDRATAAEDRERSMEASLASMEARYRAEQDGLRAAAQRAAAAAQDRVNSAAELERAAGEVVAEAEARLANTESRLRRAQDELSDALAASARHQRRARALEERLAHARVCISDLRRAASGAQLAAARARKREVDTQAQLHAALHERDQFEVVIDDLRQRLDDVAAQLGAAARAASVAETEADAAHHRARSVEEELMRTRIVAARKQASATEQHDALQAKLAAQEHLLQEVSHEVIHRVRPAVADAAVGIDASWGVTDARIAEVVQHLSHRAVRNAEIIERRFSEARRRLLSRTVATWRAHARQSRSWSGELLAICRRRWRVRRVSFVLRALLQNAAGGRLHRARAQRWHDLQLSRRVLRGWIEQFCSRSAAVQAMRRKCLLTWGIRQLQLSRRVQQTYARSLLRANTHYERTVQQRAIGTWRRLVHRMRVDRHNMEIAVQGHRSALLRSALGSWRHAVKLQVMVRLAWAAAGEKGRRTVLRRSWAIWKRRYRHRLELAAAARLHRGRQLWHGLHKLRVHARLSRQRRHARRKAAAAMLECRARRALSYWQTYTRASRRKKREDSLLQSFRGRLERERLCRILRAWRGLSVAAVLCRRRLELCNTLYARAICRRTMRVWVEAVSGERRARVFGAFQAWSARVRVVRLHRGAAAATVAASARSTVLRGCLRAWARVTSIAAVLRHVDAVLAGLQRTVCCADAFRALRAAAEDRALAEVSFRAIQANAWHGKAVAVAASGLGSARRLAWTFRVWRARAHRWKEARALCVIGDGVWRRRRCAAALSKWRQRTREWQRRAASRALALAVMRTKAVKRKEDVFRGWRLAAAGSKCAAVFCRIVLRRNLCRALPEGAWWQHLRRASSGAVVAVALLFAPNVAHRSRLATLLRMIAMGRCLHGWRAITQVFQQRRRDNTKALLFWRATLLRRCFAAWCMRHEFARVAQLDSLRRVFAAWSELRASAMSIGVAADRRRLVVPCWRAWRDETRLRVAVRNHRLLIDTFLTWRLATATAKEKNRLAAAAFSLVRERPRG